MALPPFMTKKADDKKAGAKKPAGKTPAGFKPFPKKGDKKAAKKGC